MKKCIILSILSLVCFYAVQATDKQLSATASDKKASPAQTKDYSRGFTKFYQFGLPNVKDAKYVKLSLFPVPFNGSDMFRYQAKIQGNAWLVSEDKKSGKAKLVVRNGALMEIYDQQKLIRELNKKKKDSNNPLSYINMMDGKLSGRWEKTSLKKDTKRIIEYLRNGLKKKNFWAGESCGIWFLFAIHIYSKGMKAEANELTELLFEVGKSKRKVILQALNALADSQYEAAYAEFRADHNWKKYAESIDELMKRFRKGWKKTPGMKKLSVLLHKQLDGKGGTLPKSLSDADMKIIYSMNNVYFSVFAGRGGRLWSISAIAKSGNNENTKKKPDIISKITVRGMKSVPMLIALLGDDHLTGIDRNALANNIDSFSNRVFRSSSNSDNDADEIFKKLNRPLTRGELARKLLNVIVIRDLETDDDGREIIEESDEDDTPEFKELAEKWYKTNKDKSDDEIALLYLKEGNRPQKQQAVSLLLANKQKSAYKDIEKFLLETPRPEYGNEGKDKLAIKYVGKRGKEAKEFAEKYIKLLDPDGEIQAQAAEKKQSSSKKKKNDKNGMYTGGNNPDKWRDKQILHTIEQLRDLSSDESVEDIINSLLSGKKELNKRISFAVMNRLRMSDKTTDDKIKLLLKAALGYADKKKGVDAADFIRKSYMVSMPKNSAYSQMMMFYSHGINEIPEKIIPADPAKNGKLWKKLLASKILVGEYGMNAPMTVGEISAIYAEMIYAGKKEKVGFGTLNLLRQAFGKKFSNLLIERNMARFTGVPRKKLPPIPSISKLSKDALKKKTAEVTAEVEKASDLKKCLDSLSFEKLLILKKAVADNKKLDEKLMPSANRVVEIKTSLKSASEFKKYKGKPISTKMVDEIRKFLIKEVNADKNMYCRIHRLPCAKGITITIGERPAGKLSDSPENTGSEKLVIGVISFPGSGYTRAFWKLKDKNNKKEIKEKKKNDDVDDLFGEMEEDIQADSKNIYLKKQQSFNETVKNLTDGKINSMISGMIYFSVSG